MCHLEVGSKNEITLVFSCPGRKEKDHNKPAAGKTGSNLDAVLNYLNSNNKYTWQRNVVTITNAWDKVEYKNLTGRSEATEDEVLDKVNLKRLETELKNTTKYIVTFGANAKKAVGDINKKKLNANVKFIECCHLSLSSINRSIKSDKATAAERNIDRLEQLAEKILNQL